MYVHLDLVSISKKTSFRKISSSLEAARFVFRIVRSLWNLTGTSAAVLPMCLSNFKAIRQFKVPISWLRDFTRSYDKTSFRILRWGPGIRFSIGILIMMIKTISHPLILMYFHRKRWMAPLEDEDDTTPYKVPTLAGGVIAVHSKWFRHLGGYNFPLEFWGGDNMELGFRAWLCGSGAFTHPCSIVGHVYKPPLYNDVRQKQNLGELMHKYMGH